MRELATAAGLPSGTVSALCSGRQQPNLRQLLALQRGLKLSSIEELLGAFPSLTYEAEEAVDVD
jgi:transcriptional regulator with XRE-family HTH domain